jgi:hypothetical protein
VVSKVEGTAYFLKKICKYSKYSCTLAEYISQRGGVLFYILLFLIYEIRPIESALQPFLLAVFHVYLILIATVKNL